MPRPPQDNTSNPYHREYGILQNAGYLAGSIRNSYPALFGIAFIGLVTNALMQCLWSFIGKFVIDMVQAQTGVTKHAIAPLVRLLILTTVIELTALGLHTLCDNRRGLYMMYVRMKMISGRVKKALGMQYEQLEQPDVLDLHEKACDATSGGMSGVEGMMRALYDCGVQLLLMLTAVVTVAALDIRIIIVIAAVSVLQYLYFRHTVRQDRRLVWDKLPPIWRRMRYMEQTVQNFDYAKDIRLFGMKDWLSQKQHEALQARQDKIMLSRDLWMKNTVFSNACSVLTTGAVYAVLIYAVVDRNLEIGNFTLYLGLCTTFHTAMGQFLQYIGRCKERSMEVDNFRSFMDFEAADESDCIDLPVSDSYRFEFQDVSFRYHGASGYALRHLNLTLEWGKRLAVVGLNGAGKTTMVKLLTRLYDPTEGRILLNGTDIRRYRRRDYFKLFSAVFQNVEVFAFPMSENVSMQTPEQTDAARAEEKLIAAGLGERLAGLSRGVQTELLKVIDEDGIDLSGGEKQKLALARALYKDAPVVVLDEPTAALDALAEYRLYQQFDAMIGHKTAVYISHRLSSSRFCDAVAMFKDGEMIEYGTHDELMQRGGAYAEMFAIQSQYYVDDEKGGGQHGA